MIDKEFERILTQAASGNHKALEALFSIYEPLIKKYSYISGKLDEDLQQYILIRIALNISKFSL